jgi:hypothetical protein
MEISTITYGLRVSAKNFCLVMDVQSRKIQNLAQAYINRVASYLTRRKQIIGSDLVIIPAQNNAKFAKAIFTHGN